MNSLSKEEELRVKDLEGLNNLLTTYQIPVADYGKGEAKSLKHLLDEVLSGESRLVLTSSGLIREINACGIDIYYEEGGTRFKLIEDRQEFNDGRVRRRTGASVNEKIKPGEEPMTAAKRALEEELGITDNIEIKEQKTEKKVSTSNSYPGLITLYNFFIFEAILQDAQYKPEGYIECQADKKTFFLWRRME